VVTRIGATKTVRVDVRVIAATNKHVADEIAAGRFREDLFYRLNVVPVTVPPLRQRREDIPLLVERFVAELARFEGLPNRTFAPEAVALLRERSWPGNVRELRNAVERLVILGSGGRIEAADVRRLLGVEQESAIGDLAGLDTFERFKAEAEKSFLVSKLAENDWNVSETARRLEMPRSNLYKKIEKYGLARGEE
jgi:two-component system nitrogen regulation response regulator NtrX